MTLVRTITVLALAASFAGCRGEATIAEHDASTTDTRPDVGDVSVDLVAADAATDVDRSCDENLQQCPLTGACFATAATTDANGCPICVAVAIEVCQSGDDCCPAGCGSADDDDCISVCGDGVVGPMEACDGDCPTSCDDSDSCTQDTLSGAAQTCDAVCGHETITSCMDGDGCCPASCDASRDDDCPALCGNGVVESGERCDGNCPTSCGDGNACTTDTSSGTVDECTFACTNTVVTSCTNGDGCCPAGCNTANDDDCSASCGDGVIDAMETCDPPGTCPTSCDDADACTTNVLTGSAANCSAVCSYPTVSACTNGDGCCPAGCDANNDDDCQATCGNSVVEAGETCDPVASCPTSCDDADACTADMMTGTAANCDAACTSVPITACVDADGCCPTGCTDATDDDCPAGSPLLSCEWPTGYDGNMCCWRLSDSKSTCNNGLACCDPNTIDHTNAASWPTDWRSHEDAIVVAVNQYRAMGYDCAGSYGVYPPAGPVTMNAALREAARRHSVDQAINNFVGHTGTDGSTFTQRMLDAGYAGTPSLENAGGFYGPFTTATPQEIVDAWMGSPGHCKTIMRANLFDDPARDAIDEIGIGFVNMLREHDPDQMASHRRWTLVIGASGN